MIPHIKFDAVKHTYTNIHTNEFYRSVSKIIECFKPIFDEKYWLDKKAKDNNITVAEQKEQWTAKKDFACERGTKHHEAMEDYIKTGRINREYKNLIRSYDKAIAHFIDNVIKVNSEILCYNDEYKAAGTADLLYDLDDDTFIIGDFKTNKKFTRENNWFETLLGPLKHLGDCHLSIYSIQMSIYAYMYEIVTGKTCKGLFLLWLDPNKGEWENIPCTYYKKEAEQMLKLYSTFNRDEANTIMKELAKKKKQKRFLQSQQKSDNSSNKFEFSNL